MGFCLPFRSIQSTRVSRLLVQNSLYLPISLNRLQSRQHGFPDDKDFGFVVARPFRMVRAEFHHDARDAAVPFPYQHVFVALPFDQLFRAGPMAIRVHTSCRSLVACRMLAVVGLSGRLSTSFTPIHEPYFDTMVADN